MKVLIIDDIEAVIDGVREFLANYNTSNSNKVEFETLLIDVNAEIEKIKEEIIGKDADVIFCDWGFWHQTRDIDGLSVTKKAYNADVFYDCFSDKDIVIYTYNPWNSSQFYNNWKSKNYIELKRGSTKKKFFIETSNYFNRIPGCGIYENFNENLSVKKVGKIVHIKEYGIFIGSLVLEYHIKFKCKSEKIGTHYFDENSINFNKSHSLFNEAILKTGYKLGSVSFFSEKVNEYLLDMPNKPYYSSLNKYLSDNNLLPKLSDTSDIITLYFKYAIFDNKIELMLINEIHREQDKYISRILSNHLDAEDYKFYKTWLTFLHYGIFYIKDEEYDWVKIIQRVENYNYKNNIPVSNCIELYWTFQKLEINDKVTGDLNYTFFRTNCDKYSSHDTEFIGNIQNLYRRFIESLARESLFGWYENQLKTHTLLAAAARINNRNYAHHIGSHVSHKATLDKIIERIFGYPEAEKIGNKGFIDSLIFLENRLTQYKDQRNDYIAGLGTVQRPISVYFYRDIIKPFIENSLILDNIAKGEGICWETEDNKIKASGISKLRIRVFYHADIVKDLNLKDIAKCKKTRVCNRDYLANNNKKQISPKGMGINDKEFTEMLAFYENVKEITADKDSPKELSGNVCIHRLPFVRLSPKSEGSNREQVSYSFDNDIEVAIPGNLGYHAFYSILENHIRNTAKHAPKENLGEIKNLDIIIKVSYKGEDKTDYRVELASNIPTLKHNSPVFIRNGQDSDNDFYKISKALHEDIDDTTKALGFADMRLSATLLAFEALNEKNLDKCIALSVFPEKLNEFSVYKEVCYTPCYRFTLIKSYKVAMIGESFEFICNGKDSSGIAYYPNAEDAINFLKKKQVSFEFAVLEPAVLRDINKNRIDELLSFLPHRVLLVNIGWELCSGIIKNLSINKRVTCINKIDFDKNDKGNEILEKCWKNWLNNYWLEPYQLTIYFEGEKEKASHFASKCKTLDFVNVLVKSDDNTAAPKVVLPENQLFNGLMDKITSDRSFNVIFDRHGKLLDQGMTNLNTPYFWEYFDKNNPDFDLIMTDDLAQPFISIARLIESGLHNVLVIDERAREKALTSYKPDFAGKNTYNGDILYFHYAKAARVFIADSLLVNGKEELFTPDSETPEHKLEVKFDGESIYILGDNLPAAYDSLIIHRTMLTKIEKEYWDVIDKTFPNIYVTTGGGTLNYETRIMKRIKLLPFSILNIFVLSGRIAKNSLIKSF